MLPLLVLLGSFLLLLAVRGLYKELSVAQAGRMAFGVMLLFTGSAHFYMTEGMVMSLPPFLPAKEGLVYVTGVLEIAFALALVLAKNKVMVAKLLIAFLVVVFPANVYAALHHVDMASASNQGPGPAYLFFRTPLQVFFMAWVFYFGIWKCSARFTQTIQWTVVRGRAGRVKVVEEEQRVTGRIYYWD